VAVTGVFSFALVAMKLYVFMNHPLPVSKLDSPRAYPWFISFLALIPILWPISGHSHQAFMHYSKEEMQYSLVNI
jgi:hypothetical protein